MSVFRSRIEKVDGLDLIVHQIAADRLQALIQHVPGCDRVWAICPGQPQNFTPETLDRWFGGREDFLGA